MRLAQLIESNAIRWNTSKFLLIQNLQSSSILSHSSHFNVRAPSEVRQKDLLSYFRKKKKFFLNF